LRRSGSPQPPATIALGLAYPVAQVSLVQPIFYAIEPIAAYRESYSTGPLSCTSGEYPFVVFMTPSPQEMGSSGISGRFTSALMICFVPLIAASNIVSTSRIFAGPNAAIIFVTLHSFVKLYP
jgi:hypothetical protein